jgi:hypothetical protein
VKGGATYADVAKEHLMAAKTVSKICKKHNVASRQSTLLKNKIKK